MNKVSNLPRKGTVSFQELKRGKIMRIYTQKLDKKISSRVNPLSNIPNVVKRKPEKMISGSWFNANTIEHFLAIKKFKYDCQMDENVKQNINQFTALKLNSKMTKRLDFMGFAVPRQIQWQFFNQFCESKSFCLFDYKTSGKISAILTHAINQIVCKKSPEKYLIICSSEFKANYVMKMISNLSRNDIAFDLLTDINQLKSKNYFHFLILTESFTKEILTSDPNILHVQNKSLCIFDSDEIDQDLLKLLMNNFKKQIIATCNSPTGSFNEIYQNFEKIFPTKIPVTQNANICSKAKQIFVHLDYSNKFNHLLHLLVLAQHLGNSVVVFFNSSGEAHKIEQKLTDNYPNIKPVINCSRNNDLPNKTNLKSFTGQKDELQFKVILMKNSEHDLASNTNVHAVVNYDMPQSYKEYENRSRVFCGLANDNQNMIANFVTTKEDIKLTMHIENFARNVLKNEN